MSNMNWEMDTEMQVNPKDGRPSVYIFIEYNSGTQKYRLQSVHPTFTSNPKYYKTYERASREAKYVARLYLSGYAGC